MSYDTNKITTLGQMKSALQRVYQQIVASKSVRRRINILASNWVEQDSVWKYTGIQSVSNYHYYSIHLAYETSTSLGIMCANADIRVVVENNVINFYCYGVKPEENFNIEIVISATSTNDVSISYNLGNGFKVNPSTVDSIDSRVDALELAVGSQFLIAKDVAVSSSSWTPSGVQEYPYKSEITFSGVTSDYFPLVQFRDSDNQTYKFSPAVNTSTNKVTIYCKTSPNTTVILPNILCVKSTTVSMN